MQSFIIQIENHTLVLNGSNIGVINAGKCIVAFGPLFFSASSGNDLSVKNNNNAIGMVMAGKKQPV